ncbi:MAG TPA: N-acetyl-gamma-glutamyl-phosphate reductase [Candidatus Thermoplasmatota archaeon]|nr:N-acetyl-gamma-glutamyl-phosphate reductase [Candidatus Thermoplasmatota archaeon]
MTLDVAIVGASGYTGGELLRLLLGHPDVRVAKVTSNQFAGDRVASVHPNLRKLTDLKFTQHESVESADVLFNCSPHGAAMDKMETYLKRAAKVIDLSADFRLRDPAVYERWYSSKHRAAPLLSEAVYGIPELHREAIRGARLVATAGCIATSAIVALYPLFKEGLARGNEVLVDSKVGSSASGRSSEPGSHHPERSGVVRPYAPAGHRHQAEIEQELSMRAPARVHFTAHAIELVRGISTTSHLFLAKSLDEKEIWKVYRAHYGEEPFVRIVKERSGLYRLPEPKLLAGTNYVDVGFARDPHSERLVVVSALDNLVKGSGGQAVQCMNLMHGLDETTALTFPGLHPS